MKPSPWVCRFAPRLVEPGGQVLDLACGHGRHVRWLRANGFRVTAVDRDPAAVDSLAGDPAIERIVADLEVGDWPLAGRRFEAVVVTNYLWRPRFADVLALVRDGGGALIYETFMSGHERFGRPRRAAFLLRPDELLERAAAGGLRVVAFEQGEVTRSDGRVAVVQRIAAVRGGRSAAALDGADRAEDPGPEAGAPDERR